MKPITLSAGAVIVRFDGTAPRFLILRAYSNWDFPKGECDDGEAPLAAALRETREETGLTDLVMPYGEEHRETEPYGRGKVARYYLATTDRTDIVLPVSPELGKPENDEYRWATYDEARGLLPSRLLPILEWAHDRIAATLRK